MPKIDRILVPVDYSEGSREAVAHAVMVAERFDAVIDVLHVLEVPTTVGQEVMVKMGSGETHRLSEMLAQQATTEAERFLKEFREKGTATIHVKLKEGSPARTILETAQKGGYGLVVMSTHGRSGFTRLVMGSVAETVMRSAPCPLLVVRHPEDTGVL